MLFPVKLIYNCCREFGF